jgi:Protein of unknown function (DUF2628)
MAFYSVHIQGEGIEAATEAAFVRQAFSWKAFFFGPFWLAWHRLWAALVLLATAYFALLTVSDRIIPAAAAFFIGLAFQTLLGLEANALREGKLAARGYRLVGIVAAPSHDLAEIAFFRHFDAPSTPVADTGTTAPRAAS